MSDCKNKTVSVVRELKDYTIGIYKERDKPVNDTDSEDSHT